MKTFILAIILSGANVVTAQVGIGTTTPSSNAVLDLTSTNKGVMLPRVNDTGNVSNPTEGLLVYNRTTKAPAIHNGFQWSSLLTTSTTGNDSITYTISGGANGFTNGSFPIESLSNGVSNPGGNPFWQSVSFSKPRDINSIAFIKATNTFANQALIEIRFFIRGAATPYYSIKLTNWKAVATQIGSSAGGQFIENISLDAQVIGVKDWISSTSFAWNTVTNIETGY